MELTNTLGLEFYELMHMREELQSDINTLFNALDAYENLERLRTVISEYGVEESLVELCGDSIAILSPSIFTRDKEKVLAELDPSNELLGTIIVETAKNIYKFIRDLLKKIFKWIKDLMVKEQRVHKAWLKLRKKIDLVTYIDTKALSYAGWEYKYVNNTLIDNGGFLLEIPVIDRKTAGDLGFVKSYYAAIGKYRDTQKVRDTDRLFTYQASTATFSAQTARKGFANLSSAGVENVHTLKNVLNLIGSNLDIMRDFKPAVEKFENALSVLEKEYGHSDPDVLKYVRLHGNHVVSYMATVPTIIFEIARNYMDVMNQIVRPERED